MAEAHPALLFDMDGVIIDSTAAHTAAWQRYLADHGIELEGIAERMLGKHNSEIVREFFPLERLTPERIVEHGRRKEQLYREMIAPQLEEQLVPGVLSFLERHRGCPMAVGSNAEPENVDFVLDAAGVRGFFQAVVNGHEIERPKPAPDVYLRAAEKLGVRPADCVVFEDSATGVAAARRAGMRVVGLTTTAAELDGVDLAVGNFDDPRLEPWLRDLSFSSLR